MDHRHELVNSCRGPGGGYRLGRESSQITVADIIYAVDEPLDATQCGGKQNCKDDQMCMTHELWAALSRHMVDFLDSVSLYDLVMEQKRKVAKELVPEAPSALDVVFKS